MMFFFLSKKQAIYSFIKVMNQHRLPYWLEFGTMLGAVREGKILSFDKDIDVAAPITAQGDYLRKALIDAGFKLKKVATLLSGEVIEETYKYRTAQVDVFFA